jgi:endonuclease-3
MARLATKDGDMPGELEPAAIEALFTRLAAANPEPKGELSYRNPFTLLVAVVLSAQATDAGVNKATAPLFAEVATPQAMLQLGEEGLRDRIRTIGLFNTKAKNIIALSRALLDRHGGEVPRDRDALQALPGVGRKTANVVLNTAFGEPTIAVDTHVFRVANRTGLVCARTPEEAEAQLLARVPARWLQHAHHWLILHGRYICVARRPACWRCPIADLCRYEPKTPEPGTAATPAAASPRRRRVAG